SESARGSDPPEMGGIFKSDSGFATSDLSTGKRLFSVKLVRRAKPLEKKHHPCQFWPCRSSRCPASAFQIPKKNLLGAERNSPARWWRSVIVRKAEVSLLS
ncbi:hypothetical protein, partial [Plesiomonas shigelloides]|uniref:hypothetical protein n=1 Tax=Plesiomonas shigelloides TaxID=703 RepID=UPI001C49C616